MKYAAWALKWHDTPFPLFIGADDLDLRMDSLYISRCYGPSVDCTNFTKWTDFASQHHGYLYHLGDEPDQNGLPAATYAENYHRFVTAIQAVDPSARFQPAGFAEDNPFVVNADGHFTTYAQNFYNYYNAHWGPPPVVQWEFHTEVTDDWSNQIELAAEWCAAKSTPMVLTWARLGKDASYDIKPDILAMVNQTKNDSRIALVYYWSFDLGNQAHKLGNADGTLTSDGQYFASITLAAPSTAGNSASSLADFDNNHCADYADHYKPNGHFWAHQNLCNGTFSASNYAEGDTSVGTDWDQQVADFNGDGYADFVDIHKPSGSYWIHLNQHNGTFNTVAWAQGVIRGGSDFEILVGDFNGDHLADLVEHQVSTGLFWVRFNPGTGGTAIFAYANNGDAVGRTMYGPDWRTVVGDFTGDGRADFADQHLPSGQFWVHRNLPGDDATTFYIKTTNWGLGQAAGGSGWRTIIGDFDGDGWTDFADVYEPTGQFWMHQNFHNGLFTPPGQSWGSMGQVTAGSDWEVLGSR